MKPVLPPELRPATNFVRAMVVLNWLVPPVVLFLAFMSFAVGISSSKRQDPGMNRGSAHFFILVFVLLALSYLASAAFGWRNRIRIRRFVSSITGGQRGVSVPALAGLFSTTAALSSLPKRPHYELP